MMVNRVGLLLLAAMSSIASAAAQEMNSEKIFWRLHGEDAIVWDLQHASVLPHGDNMEMAGQNVAGIIHYEVDKGRTLRIRRDIIFPQLRTLIRTNEPDWMNYRAYLRKVYNDDVLPVITVQNRIFEPGIVDSVVINGKLNFYHGRQQGLKVIRTLMPSMTDRMFLEKWTLVNVSDSTIEATVGQTLWTKSEQGFHGTYRRDVYHDAAPTIRLKPSGKYEFAVYFTARLNDEPTVRASFKEVQAQRDAFLTTMKNNLMMRSPDSVLNTLFYFSKIRAAESIFDTKMGLIHSPGGGRYYTGIWANDQAEYSGPFFPYLGYDVGNEAALNTYRMFLKHLPPPGEKIWSSFEMNGDLPCCSKDRGDAAMLALGASQFALTSGNRKYAEELWPLIAWGINYSESKKNTDGVVTSTSDELEGRFPTGTANLSTSSLHYGALLHAATLARALGRPASISRDYNAKAKSMAEAIEKYFGAEVNGLHTYKYYKENTTLRSWICLPLVMGIENRKEGTLDALFNHLWTDNGVKIEDNPETKEAGVFWDRGTLYAFRGAFKAGAADRSLVKLQTYASRRLLGFHTPYVVEAWPEGDMAHLSAESALYCRIFTEGVLGMTPTGLHSFIMRPRIPTAWDHFELSNIKAFNTSFDVSVQRSRDRLRVRVTQQGKTIFEKSIRDGETVTISFK
ncbi:MAG TPA: hypothetical protein VD816_01225 [Ohtaekwangia sp.]|nr:hypothetical protein [Ohtaekwangia sp.]